MIEPIDKTRQSTLRAALLAGGLDLPGAATLATRWAREQLADVPGAVGAFLHGSILWLPDGQTLAPESDLDLLVVVDADDPSLWARGDGAGVRRGKQDREGVLLEVSLLSARQVATGEQVLADPHLAGSLRRNSVVFDPTGRLGPVQQQVAAEFDQRRWRETRARAVQARAREWLARVAEAPALPQAVTAWLFGIGVMSHVHLVAAGWNPTVRKRFALLREWLAQHDRLAEHERLLALLGCRDWTAEQTATHLEALASHFDAMAGRIDPAYVFAADLMPDARPVAIDGSAVLIEQGLHREAVFWLVAVWCRCLLGAADPAVQWPQMLPGLWALLRDLGMDSEAALRARADAAIATLPRLWREAEVWLPAR